ncbi:hypothetical protein Tco_1319841, partial [Tanacetum coccineum]
KPEFSMVDAYVPYTCWDACIMVLCNQGQRGSVPELLHKNFRDFNRDSESLATGRVLDDMDHNLKGFFLMWHSSLQSNIGSTDLDSFLSGNPLFIRSINLTSYFLIHDSA